MEKRKKLKFTFDGKTVVRLLLRTLLYLILIFIAVIMMYPFLWMLGTSFKSPHENLTNLGVYLFPKEFTFDNYPNVFRIIPFLRGLGNTLTIVFTVIPVGMFTTFMGAYGFAKLKFPGKNIIFMILLTGMMLPFVATFMPQFVAYTKLGFHDSLFPLIFGGLFGSLGVLFFLRQFMANIPNDLIEAAKIDGAGQFRICWQIIFPLSLPAVATQVVFWFLAIWNDVFGPDMYLVSIDKKTLQIMMKWLDMTAASGGLRNRGMLMAGSVLCSLPTLILYLTCQKFFVGSIAISGIKG